MDYITSRSDKIIFFSDKNKYVLKYKSALKGKTFNVLNHNVLKRHSKIQ